MEDSSSNSKLNSTSYTYLVCGNPITSTGGLASSSVVLSSAPPPQRVFRPIAGNLPQDDRQLSKIIGKDSQITYTVHPYVLPSKLEDFLPPVQQAPKNSSGEFVNSISNTNDNFFGTKFKYQIQISFIHLDLPLVFPSNDTYQIQMIPSRDTGLVYPNITEYYKYYRNTPKSPDLRFKLSQEAAIHNMKLLQQHDTDLQNYLLKNGGTFIGFGSEFRCSTLLEPLLLHHPNWWRLKQLLEQGSNWQLDELSHDDRLAKNDEFISRGNHKSAKTYDKKLCKTIIQEIKQGWMFPLPLHYISTLKHGELAPMGIDDSQWSKLPDGSKKTKYRMTHDQSFEASRGNSVNIRVDRDSLEPLYYGGCLSHVIHYIISIQAHQATVQILGGKSDFKAAYRRVNLHGDTASKCSIVYKDFSLPSFGGSPCPNEFCVISELCTDLANDILHCPQWDPTELKSPHIHLLLEPNLLEESILFGKQKT